MKRFYIIIFSIFLVSSPIAEPIESNIDKELFQLIIGTWVIHPQDEIYYEIGAITEYRSDGVVVVDLFRDASCKLFESHIEGKWNISNKILSIVVTKGDEFLKNGEIIIDDIINLTTNEMVLKSTDDGSLQYRLRSKGCVTES